MGYVTFLLIHPFVDRNGRVVRGILDYYNRRLGFGLTGSWNNISPKFANRTAHKEAFQIFFRNSGLKTRGTLSLHPIPDELRADFGNMADSLLYEIAQAADKCKFEEWEPVQALASIIT